MGQAKQRGTFEERKAAALAREHVKHARVCPRRYYASNRVGLMAAMLLGAVFSTDYHRD